MYYLSVRKFFGFLVGTMTREHGEDILNPFNQYKIITSLLGSVWNLMFLILMIVKYFILKEQQNINTIVVILLCCFFGMASFTLIINAIGVAIYNNWQNISFEGDKTSLFLLCTYDLSMPITLLFAYTFYAAQLYFTFENSAMSISQNVKYLHIIAIFVIILVTITIFILFFIDTNHYEIGRSLVLLTFALLIFPTLHLIILLNSRLFTLIISQRQRIHSIRMRKRTRELQNRDMESVQSHTITHDHHPDHQRRDEEEEEKREIEMNERQLLLIKVITKMSALWGILLPDAILIVFMGTIAFALGSVIIFEFIFWTIFSCGHMIGSLCFFLTLSLNESWFNVLCGKCNRFCAIICSQLAKKSMRAREEYGDQNELEIEYWD